MEKSKTEAFSKETYAQLAELLGKEPQQLTQEQQRRLVRLCQNIQIYPQLRHGKKPDRTAKAFLKQLYQKIGRSQCRARANYCYNRQLEAESEQQEMPRYIFSQAASPVGNMHFAEQPAKDTACEAIAVYNLLQMLCPENKITLSDIIYRIEINGHTFFFRSGVFGTNIFHISRILADYGIASRHLSCRTFEKMQKETEKKRYIVSILNDKRDWYLWPVRLLQRMTGGKVPLFYGVHTFLTEESSEGYIVYNRHNRKEKPDRYQHPKEILEKTGQFLWITQITE